MKRSVEKYQIKLKEVSIKVTLRVVAIYVKVKMILCPFHCFTLVLSAEFQYKHLFFLLFFQYLELRFNKYLRLCGTVLFIIQTVSKP